MVLISVAIVAIQPHSPQSCMPNSVERLLEVHEGFAGVASISHRVF